MQELITAMSHDLEFLDKITVQFDKYFVSNWYIHYFWLILVSGRVIKLVKLKIKKGGCNQYTTTKNKISENTG